MYQVWRAAAHDDTRQSQAIIVLGAAQYNGRPSPVYRARLDHAADLYTEGVAPIVVVTGGKQPGDKFTEAGAGADYLHTQGCARRRDPARDDGPHVVGVARRIGALPAARAASGASCSSPTRSTRCGSGSSPDELGFDAVTSPTRTSPIDGFDEWRRFFGEALRVAVGRIFGFGRLARASTALRTDR